MDRFSMNTPAFSREELVQAGRLMPEDMEVILQCRQPYTRLGFAYQLVYVRLYNRLPGQQPLEIVEEILSYLSLQLGIPTAEVEVYQEQRRTIINHHQEIRDYLKLRTFGEAEATLLRAFLFDQAGRLEQTGPLLVQAKQFLRQQGILFPANASVDLAMLEHISPIGWDNIVLYGEYVLNRSLVKP